MKTEQRIEIYYDRPAVSRGLSEMTAMGWKAVSVDCSIGIGTFRQVQERYVVLYEK